MLALGVAPSKFGVKMSCVFVVCFVPIIFDSIEVHSSRIPFRIQHPRSVE